MARSRRAKRKEAVRELLLRRDIEGIRGLTRKRPTVVSALAGFLSETDDLLRWRAIEALGWTVADLAEDDLEPARVQVRRQLWTMTEESGGTAWHAPEAVGEILYRVPALAKEFTSVLAGNGDTEPFEAGVLWAMGRLAHGPGRAGAQDALSLFLWALGSADPAQRGYAAIAVGELNLGEAVGKLRRLLKDEATFNRYDFDRGELRRSSVGELASASLARFARQ